MKDKVLITGGTGLIGQAIIKRLANSNYEPMLLSHSSSNNNIRTHHWSINNGEIDSAVVQQAYHIIHLAGASVAGRRWTRKYKQQIIDSRIKGIELIYRTLLKSNHRIKTFISASAIGYYGGRGNDMLGENESPGDDFLADVCTKWEAAADIMKDCAERVVKLRTGIVLSNEGGALPQIITPMKFGVSVIFGNGKQYYSWIHINDMARMYLFALENNISGVFNATAPAPVTFNDLIRAIEKARNIRTLKINFPLSLLKLPLGEFVETLYMSQRASSNKIEESGFKFQYDGIEDAMKNFINNPVL